MFITLQVAFRRISITLKYKSILKKLSHRVDWIQGHCIAIYHLDDNLSDKHDSLSQQEEIFKRHVDLSVKF